MFAVFSASLAPTLALMSFFYLKDKFEAEPLSDVLRAFIYGALLVFPLMFVQYAFNAEGIGQQPFIKSFFLTGLMEEFFKWFVYIYTVYRYTKFDTVYDGIVYGVSISLGFATLENILYLFTYGVEYAVGRALFPVSSHALFGVIMGFYIGKAKLSKTVKRSSLLLGLLLPVFAHGTYDFILATVQKNWVYFLIPFMILLWMYGMRKVKQANQQPRSEAIIKKTEP